MTRHRISVSLALVGLLDACVLPPLSSGDLDTTSTGVVGDDGHSSSPSDDGATSSPATTTPTTTPQTTTEAETSSVDSDPTSPDTDTGEIPEDCDIYADECPEGYKCMPEVNEGSSGWTGTQCSPLDPNPKSVGEPCTVQGSRTSGIDDCGLHSMCWEVDPDTNMGECVAFCYGSEADPSCADACSACSISSSGVLNLCLPTCDPLQPESCGDDLCVPIAQLDTFVCASDASGDAGALGDACEYVNVCDPGLFCAASEVLPDCDNPGGCCAAFCDLDDVDACAAVPGTVCTPWTDEVPFEGCIGGPVGACVLPGS